MSTERMRGWIGREMVSDWRTIDQRAIDAYADVTGDRDWLHNDPARAARESPFGTTIVQGSFLLGTIVDLAGGAVRPMWEDTGMPVMGLNYGFDRARFVRPVPVDSRIRARVVLRAADDKAPGRCRVRMDVTIEREGATEPSVIAEWLVMVFHDAGAASTAAVHG